MLFRAAPRWLTLALVSLACPAISQAAEPLGSPLGWRTDASGCYADATPPTKWSATENVLWKTAMPGRSFGSPVVVGDKVLVVSDPAELLCLSAADGAILWRRTCSATEALGPAAAEKMQAEWNSLNEAKRQLEKQLNDLRKANPDAKDEQEKLKAQAEAAEQRMNDFKRKNPIQQDRGSGNSAATPICDGKNVYASFGSGIVAACTLAGEPLWTRFVEGSIIGFGHSSSPVLVGEKLIVHYHDLVALNAKTGEIAWRTELPARHATPIAIRLGEDDALSCPSGSVVRVSDGKVLFEESALRVSEGSPVTEDGVLYAQADKTSAFRLPTGGDVTKLELLWQATASRGRRTPSPVLHDGLLYGATTEGILDVTDAETGDVVYRKRLDLGENLYSSVTAAGDSIYITNTKGTTLVLAPGREFTEIARNELESLGSNPVFVGKRLYFRGHKNLYCIGQ
jgi:outer membrane protein assembly factor BamB